MKPITSEHTLQLRLILGLLLLWGFVSMSARAADVQKSREALQGLEKWLSVQREERKPIMEQEFADVGLTKSDADKAQKLLWQDYVTSLKKEAALEWENKRIRLGTREMKFDYRIFGTKPKDGGSLYISLHGGGGAPKQVNDSLAKPDSAL